MRVTIEPHNDVPPATLPLNALIHVMVRVIRILNTVIITHKFVTTVKQFVMLKVMFSVIFPPILHVIILLNWFVQIIHSAIPSILVGHGVCSTIIPSA
ncbi:unnamed protein product [Rotaria magnacalcarata]|uniref:Uncharacterized protein n=2 Tax=Rotaria magnacalcarata TaxID=392030 RepID=A0A8S2TXZ4_9BILA|nr:unnamed protein product [Rotaria magnacalcarata]CAF4310598.1 unnamed protein product [Rotaria magnacalcarata]CAF5108485.1 unnamed protein product [Rotaria magnacalcarata]